MFCPYCGQENNEEDAFCEHCGTRIGNEPNERREKFFSFGRNTASMLRHIPPWKILASLFFMLFLAGGFFALYHFYQSYQLTERTILETSKELEETQEKLNTVASSTSLKLTDQQQELNQKNDQITKLEGDLKSTQSSNISSSTVASNAIASLSPSVVKIVCNSNAESDDLQLGSGVLYHSSDGIPADYFVETNLHVVQTDDGSPSECAIAIYPNYINTSTYVLYKTSGYKTYRYGVDFAYVIPEIVTDSKNAGTMKQLAQYAKNLTSSTYCPSASIGDHMSILGYPGVGGSSLTATDGIVSGFEKDDGAQFIKTSAKIEHGNSGGVAIKDSGCILGIPTFVETGSAESIGRILDLHDLFNTNH